MHNPHLSKEELSLLLSPEQAEELCPSVSAETEMNDTRVKQLESVIWKLTAEVQLLQHKLERLEWMLEAQRKEYSDIRKAAAPAAAPTAEQPEAAASREVPDTVGKPTPATPSRIATYGRQQPRGLTW